MKNRIYRIVSGIIALSYCSPVLATGTSFECNASGDMNSNVDVSILPEEVVVEGRILLREFQKDDQFPAYGMVKFFDPNRDISITLGMRATKNEDKTMISLATNKSGAVSEIRTSYFSDHPKSLDYKIWARPENDIVLQLGEEGLVLSNPFETGFDVKLGCAGSGSFRIKAKHQLFDERQEFLMSQVPLKSARGENLSKPSRNRNNDADNVAVLGDWYLSHTAGFAKKKIRSFKIYEYQQHLATQMDGKFVKVNWDGTNISFERRVQVYFEGKKFGSRHIYAYTGRLKDGVLSGVYEHLGTEKSSGPQAPSPSSFVRSPVEWIASRERSKETRNFDLDRLGDLIGRNRK